MLPQMVMLTGKSKVVRAFTSSTTWVAPAGVTAIKLVGKGADGTAAGTAWEAWNPTKTSHPRPQRMNSHASSTTFTPAMSSTETWGNWVVARKDSFVTALNAGGSGERSITLTSGAQRDIYNNSTLTPPKFASDYEGASASFTVRGTFSVGVQWQYEGSGAIAPADSTTLHSLTTGSTKAYVSFIYPNGEVQVSTSATTGSDTTGFGYTFAGGNGGPATTTTYESVAVTPGNSYGLTVPAGGSITLTY